MTIITKIARNYSKSEWKVNL